MMHGRKNIKSQTGSGILRTTNKQLGYMRGVRCVVQVRIVRFWRRSLLHGVSYAKAGQDDRDRSSDYNNREQNYFTPIIPNDVNNFEEIKKTEMFQRAVRIDELRDVHIILLSKFYTNLMFCWPCIVIYPYNKNQQDAIFTFNLLQ